MHASSSDGATGSPWRWTLIQADAGSTLCFFLLMALIAARSGSLDALLTEIIPGTQRGSMMSLMMATGQLGFGAGGALTGAVYAAVGYEGNATLAAGAAIGVALVAWRFLPEPHATTSTCGGLPRAPGTKVAAGGAGTRDSTKGKADSGRREYAD